MQRRIEEPADILTNRKSIHGKEEEVNSVKQLVWNRVPKERRTSHEQLECEVGRGSSNRDV